MERDWQAHDIDIALRTMLRMHSSHISRPRHPIGAFKHLILDILLKLYRKVRVETEVWARHAMMAVLEIRHPRNRARLAPTLFLFTNVRNPDFVSLFVLSCMLTSSQACCCEDR